MSRSSGSPAFRGNDSHSQNYGSPTSDLSFDDNLEEMMVIDINFAKGKSDEIVVHFGDSPIDLAEAFVKKHGLKQSSVSLIAKHIEFTIQEFKESNTEIRPQTPPEDREEQIDTPKSSNSRRGHSKYDERDRDKDRAQTRDRDGYDQHQPPVDLPGSSSQRGSPSSFRRSPSPRSKQSPRNRQDDRDRDRDRERDRDYDRNKHRRDHRDRDRDRDFDSVASSLSEESGYKHRRGGGGEGKGSSSHRSNSASKRDHRQDYSPQQQQYLQQKGSNRSMEGKDLAQLADLDVPDHHGHVHVHPDIDYREDAEAIDAGPPTAEERFYKLRNDFLNVSKKPSVQAKGGNAATASASATADVNKSKFESVLGVLQPKSSVLRLEPRKSSNEHDPHNSSNLSITSNMTPGQQEGKVSASDRLYKSAQTLKARQEYRKRLAEETEAKQIKEKQFRVAGVSKQIMPASRKGSEVDIGNRLYTEAINEKQRKLKEMAKFQNMPKPDDWSCSKCGEFHKAATIDLKTVASHHVSSVEDGKGKASSDSQTAVSKQPKICRNCGFDQSTVANFKPSNIALIESTDPEKLTTIRRFNTETGEDLFGYLHNNKLGESMKLEKMKMQWKELDSVLTFKPELPEKSAAIVKTLAEKSKKVNSSTTVHDISAIGGEGGGVDSSHLNNTTLNSDAPIDISLYVAMPVVERLTHVKTVKPSTSSTDSVTNTTVTDIKKSMYSTCSAVSGTFASNANRGTTSKHGKDALKPKPAPTFLLQGPPVKPRKEINLVVEKLHSEATEIVNKKIKAEKDFYKVDRATGQELFKPKIPEFKSNTTTSTTTSSCSSSSGAMGDAQGKKKDIVDVILGKDELLRQHRKQLEIEAEEKLKADFKKNKATALKQSEKILNDAKQRNIEEMFRLLLASTDEWVLQNRNQMSESERAETISRISAELIDWENMKLDLGLVESNMMIPEVQSLLDHVLARQAEVVGRSRGRRSCDEDYAPAPLTIPTTATATASKNINNNGHGNMGSASDDYRERDHVAIQSLSDNVVFDTTSNEIERYTASSSSNAIATHDELGNEISLLGVVNEDHNGKRDDHMSSAVDHVDDSNDQAGEGLFDTTKTNPITSTAIVPRMSRAQASRRNNQKLISNGSGSSRSSNDASNMNAIVTVADNDNCIIDHTASRTSLISDLTNNLSELSIGIDDADNAHVNEKEANQQLRRQLPQQHLVSDNSDSNELRLSGDLEDDAVGDAGPVTNDTNGGFSALSDATGQSDESMLVTFEKFHQLVTYCLNKRNGTGKRYIYAPKKKPEVAMELINKVLAEETFRPQLDPKSDAIGKKKIASREVAPKTNIGDVLIQQGEKIKQRALDMRVKTYKEETKECTFKPTLFKPPKNVVPRYHGQGRRASVGPGTIATTGPASCSAETSPRAPALLDTPPPPPPPPPAAGLLAAVGNENSVDHDDEDEEVIVPSGKGPLLRSLTENTYASSASLSASSSLGDEVESVNNASAVATPPPNATGDVAADLSVQTTVNRNQGSRRSSGRSTASSHSTHVSTSRRASAPLFKLTSSSSAIVPPPLPIEVIAYTSKLSQQQQLVQASVPQGSAPSSSNNGIASVPANPSTTVRNSSVTPSLSDRNGVAVDTISHNDDSFVEAHGYDPNSSLADLAGHPVSMWQDADRGHDRDRAVKSSNSSVGNANNMDSVPVGAQVSPSSESIADPHEMAEEPAKPKRLLASFERKKANAEASGGRRRSYSDHSASKLSSTGTSSLRSAGFAPVDDEHEGISSRGNHHDSFEHHDNRGIHNNHGNNGSSSNMRLVADGEQEEVGYDSDITCSTNSSETQVRDPSIHQINNQSYSQSVDSEEIIRDYDAMFN